jgi:hypothetical protein
MQLPIIPPWAKALVALAVVGWLEYQLVDFVQEKERAACALQSTRTELAQASTDLHASEGLRAKAGNTFNLRSEAADDHIDRIRTMETQLAAARDASERLRRQLAATVSQAQQQCGAAGDPAAEQGRQAVEALAAVFGACEAEQRDLAAAAADHYSTGLRCEAEYAALTPPVTPASGADQ